ncbi:hypothetical protein RRF57_001519 [Xylaria bambusicola]|uniref:Cytochrome P450 n=1 Tax=Xylaria bambusicola TaxID=326684 RepID=A0AAN7UCK2_9PEZI
MSLRDHEQPALCPYRKASCIFGLCTCNIKIKSLSATGPIYVGQLHEKYGPVVRLGPSQVGVADIAAAKKIYTVKGDFVKTDYYLGLGYRKENVINTLGPETHRRHRKLLSQPMSETSLKAMDLQIEEKIIRFVDIYKWWICMATDTIGQLTFGESFHMLKEEKVNTAIRDLQLVRAVSSIRTQLWALMPILYQFLIGRKTKKRRQDSIIKIRLPGFTDSLKTMSDRQSKDAIAKLQKLGEEMENKGEQKPRHYHTDWQKHFSTTSNTLTYLTWALCRNPELRDQLVKELKTLPAEFTDEHLKTLPESRKRSAASLLYLMAFHDTFRKKGLI